MESQCSWGFPGGSAVKNPPAVQGDTGSIPGLGTSPGEGNGNPLQCPCLENPHGQRSLAGYSPWGREVGHDSSDLVRTHACQCFQRYDVSQPLFPFPSHACSPAPVLLTASLSSFGAGRVYGNQPDHPEPVTLVGDGDSEVQRLHAHTHLTPLVSCSLEVIPPMPSLIG